MPNKFLAPRKFWLQKLCPKKYGPRNYGSKKCRPKQIFGPKKFEYKKILGPKNLGYIEF